MNFFKSTKKSKKSNGSKPTTSKPPQKPAPKKGLWSLFCGCMDRNDTKETDRVLQNDISLKKQPIKKTQKSMKSIQNNYELSELRVRNISIDNTIDFNDEYIFPPRRNKNKEFFPMKEDEYSLKLVP